MTLRSVLIVALFLVALVGVTVDAKGAASRRRREAAKKKKEEERKRKALPHEISSQLAPYKDEVAGMEVVRDTSNNLVLRAEYLPQEVIYTFGDSATSKGTLYSARNKITTPFTIYRNPSHNEHISDFAFSGSRTTEKGGANTLCDPPTGSKLSSLELCISDGESGAMSEIKFVFHNGATCYMKTGTEKRCRKFIIGGADENRMITEMEILRADDFITYFRVYMWRKIKADPNAAGAQTITCGTKPVALVAKAITGLILKESTAVAIGTEFVDSAKSTGTFVTVDPNQDTDKSHAQTTTTLDEIATDLTDRVMVSFLAALPCTVSVPGKPKPDIQLQPMNSRLKRLFLPVESCMSTATTTETKGAGLTKTTNAQITTTGSIDFSAGSCKLPDKYQWLDLERVLDDVGHLIDISGSQVKHALQDLDVTPAVPKPDSTVAK